MRTNTLWPVSLYSPTSSTIDATTTYGAAIFAAMPGKTITKIGWYSSAVSGSPVVDIKLETVSGGLPTGTLAATGTELTGQSISAATWYNHTLGTSYTVPTGAVTILAAVVRHVSGTSVTTNIRSGFGSWSSALPRPVYGAAATTATLPIWCVEYSDGTISTSYPVVTSSAAAFTSASSPDEYGNAFVPTSNVAVVGIVDAHRCNSTSGTIRYRIYDDALNVLTTDSELSFTAGADFRASSGSTETHMIMLQSPIYLIAGRTYYITVAATSTDANVIYTYTMTFNSVAHRSAWYSVPYLCSRTNDTGAFTTDTTKVEMIAPLIDYSYGLKGMCMAGGLNG